MAEEKLRFQRGDATITELRRELDEIAAELRTPGSEAAEAARKAGIDPSELDGIGLKADEEGQGLDPLTTAVVVGIVIRVGAHVATKVWDEVVWPRLKGKLGASALGERVN